jgi:hypothetical protein
MATLDIHRENARAVAGIIVRPENIGIFSTGGKSRYFIQLRRLNISNGDAIRKLRACRIRRRDREG